MPEDSRPGARGPRATHAFGGGAERDRTVDLLNAIQALYQLSYGPTGRESAAIFEGPGRGSRIP
jgi:hypothetical protein